MEENGEISFGKSIEKDKLSGVILFLSAVITSSWDPVTRLGLSTRKV